jgi:membrane-bound serine protease (ClpP class)
MKRSLKWVICCWAAVLLIATLGLVNGQDSTSDKATLLRIDGAIGPAISDYLVRGIEQSDAHILIIEMDTPGGLDSAMRDIIQAILASPRPVVTYVTPQGARAASAGTYILYASHVAAMAPATNLGAATPVSIGGSGGATQPGGDDDADDANKDGGDNPTESAPSTAMERKVINDAIAYIRGLAERRGRNAEWAEDAVRTAASLSATAALEANVVDIVATDLNDLLQQLDGREVEVNGETLVLDTDGLLIERVEPDWRTKVLEAISNPTVAYFLLLAGIYGLIFEGYNPGAMVPGVVGAVCLLLALFALQVLPVNYVGLALIVLGLLLIIGETLVPSFGVLGLGGIIAFVFGSVILMDTDVPGFGLPVGIVVTTATIAGSLLMATVWFTIRSRQHSVVSGAEELVGMQGEALEDFHDIGAVWVHGERWRARSVVPITKGQRIKVRSLDGLTVEVEPLA